MAIDAETKLVPCFRVGKRTKLNAIAFMGDLSERLANRVQFSSDALNSYVDAVEQASARTWTMDRQLNFTKLRPDSKFRWRRDLPSRACAPLDLRVGAFDDRDGYSACLIGGPLRLIALITAIDEGHGHPRAFAMNRAEQRCEIFAGARGVVWDDRYCAFVGDRFAQAVAVISGIGHNDLCRRGLDQGVGPAGRRLSAWP